MNRRDFLRAAGVAGAATAVQRGDPAPNDRDVWVEVMRRIADPVLTHAANRTLKARIPVELAVGADRRSVTHLEAVGRLLAGVAPWMELPPDTSPEGILRARYVELARATTTTAS